MKDESDIAQTVLAREEWLAPDELAEDAADTPHVHWRKSKGDERESKDEKGGKKGGTNEAWSTGRREAPLGHGTSAW